DGSPAAARATSPSSPLLTGGSALSVITAAIVTVQPLTNAWTDSAYWKVERERSRGWGLGAGGRRIRRKPDTTDEEAFPPERQLAPSPDRAASASDLFRGRRLLL